ncbi:hypothetical protein B0T17DRAFT_250738 [Bombardia bombarda]|uniref:Uncharacterized protein n=1 Tax=Bombardia bombarda TaxID=252184 RepID=A0AA39WZW6_9PEZI|nr:hypothetical protein B0T17DRAFT_250738 [Bombardia bombarda]
MGWYGMVWYIAIWGLIVGGRSSSGFASSPLDVLFCFFFFFSYRVFGTHISQRDASAEQAGVSKVWYGHKHVFWPGSYYTTEQERRHVVRDGWGKGGHY